MINDNEPAGPRYALVSVSNGRLVDDLSVNETFATEEDARAAADDLCTSIAGSERALQPGEGYWLFEIKPMRFVGRP